MKDADEVTKYARMGRAALLPGMQYMLDLMQRQLDEMRATLEAAAVEPRRRGRPPRYPVRTTPSGSGWPDDPEERSKEMKRRMAVAKAKREASAKAASNERRRKAAQERWNKMSSHQRKAWQRNISRAREAAQAARTAAPVVKMAVA